MPVPAEAHHLRDVILSEARGRGMDLDEYGLRIEYDLPVLRVRLGRKILWGCRISLPSEARSARHVPDVITVHGSGDRNTRTWQRKRDGTFNVDAITNHLLALVEEELSRPRPDITISGGVPVGASGLHVLRLAGIYLGVMEPWDIADGMIDLVHDPEVQEGIRGRLYGRGLLEKDLRAVADTNGLSLWRPRDIEGDAFEPMSDVILTVLRICIEPRYVLILDHRGDEIEVADPAGDGIVTMKPEELIEAWTLGAKKGKRWLATISVR